MSRTRNFVFTNFNLNSKEVWEQNDKKIKFMAWGEETCPSTGRQHHQGFMTFYSAQRSLNNIGKLFKLTETDVHVNVQPMYGSLEQNEEYCSKQSELQTVGEPPNQGARKDLETLKNDILNGKRVDDITIQNPIMYHQYGRTLEKIEAITLRKKFRTTMTTGLWIWGPTGTGKSHEAFKDFSPDTHYVKNLNEEWWDGYTGQPIVIFNEFRGQTKFSELLDLLDKYPKSVKIRNHEPVPFLAQKLIITSCKHPSEIYVNCCEHLDQLYRRCEIWHMAQKWSEGNNE